MRDNPRTEIGVEMYKRHNFEYRVFVQKRERMIDALRALEDDEDDASALSVLQAATFSTL